MACILFGSALPREPTSPPERASTMSSSAVTYARDNQQRFLGELKDLLRIPSVSTLPADSDDVRRAAQFVADEMKRGGMEHVEVIPTSGQPLVYGDWLHASQARSPLCCRRFD